MGRFMQVDLHLMSTQVQSIEQIVSKVSKAEQVAAVGILEAL